LERFAKHDTGLAPKDFDGASLRNSSLRAFLSIIMFLSAAGGVCGISIADTFFGESPTGLIELKNYRYPVYLYVPQNYKPDRTYPLIVSIPKAGESPEKNIQYWTNLAKRRSMLVVSAENLRPEDVPYAMDEWLLGILKDIKGRYRIDEGKVFLAGREGGAHYAAYLATNYPAYFSAAVLMDGSWSGPYEALLNPKNRAVKQVPFLVVAHGDDNELTQIEKKALKFEEKGYLVSLLRVPEKGTYDSDDFKKKILEWLTEKSDVWQGVVKDSQKSFKEKTYAWFENFFRVQ